MTNLFVVEMARKSNFIAKMQLLIPRIPGIHIPEVVHEVSLARNPQVWPLNLVLDGAKRTLTNLRFSAALEN